MAGTTGAAVSMTALKVVAVLTLPAASVVIMVRLWLPSVSAGFGVKFQLPVPSTGAVPITLPFSLMVIVEFASAVPVKVGVLSLVGAPEMTGAGVPTLSVTLLITGAVVSVSTFTEKPAEGALTLPAASVEVTVIGCKPWPKSVVGVKVHVPPVPTTAVPIDVPLSRIVIVDPISPLPVIVGRGSLVACPLATLPVIGATSSVTVVMVGCVGRTVSTVITKFGDLPLTRTPSSWLTAKVCGPSDNGVVNW